MFYVPIRLQNKGSWNFVACRTYETLLTCSTIESDRFACGGARGDAARMRGARTLVSSFCIFILGSLTLRNVK